MVFVPVSHVSAGDDIDHTTINTIADDLDAVRPRILQPVAIYLINTAVYGGLSYTPIIALGDASSLGTAAWSFLVPADFASLSKAVVRYQAHQSGNVRYQLFSSHSAIGEAYTAHQITGTTTTLAVTADQQGEIDVSAAFTGMAANVTHGFYFARHGEDALDTIADFWIQPWLDIEYSV